MARSISRAGLGVTAAKLVCVAVLLAVGICLYVEVGLGSDSIDVLLDGMSRTFGITLGQADQIFVGASIVIAFLVNRKVIGIPSLVGTVGASLLIDVANLWIAPLDLAAQALPIRLAALAAGQVCLGGAYGISQTIARGMNVTDAVVKRASEIAPGSYVTWRMVFDVVFLVAGMALGGVFGIGTVFYVAVNGVSIKAAARLTRAIEARLVRASDAEACTA